MVKGKRGVIYALSNLTEEQRLREAAALTGGATYRYSEQDMVAD